MLLLSKKLQRTWCIQVKVDKLVPPHAVHKHRKVLSLDSCDGRVDLDRISRSSSSRDRLRWLGRAAFSASWMEARPSCAIRTGWSLLPSMSLGMEGVTCARILSRSEAGTPADVTSLARVAKSCTLRMPSDCITGAHLPWQLANRAAHRAPRPVLGSIMSPRLSLGIILSCVTVKDIDSGIYMQIHTIYVERYDIGCVWAMSPT